MSDDRPAGGADPRNGRHRDRGGRALTPVSELIARLQQRGIVLRVEDGGLRFRAPKGALTAELRAEAQTRTSELLAWLDGAAADSPIRAVDRTQPLRMSFGQERIWFLYRLEGPGSTYNITPVFRLRGRLSLPALRTALAQLAARHETLRMRFSELDGRGVQIVDPPADVPVAMVSLADLPEAQRMARAEHIILAETARPFDLESAPPLRVTLVTLGPDDHMLLPFMHHIAADGWSLSVMQRELTLFYAAAIEGREAALPPLDVQYPDFAAWQRQVQEGAGGRAALEWWTNQLAEAPQMLALPLDFERPATLTFNGRVLHRDVPPRVAAAVAACGRAHGCSLFMVLLAAYAVLLYRHSGQRDILIGSPVAGRSRRELEALIGCFVNTLVFRVRLDTAPTFADLLQQVRQTALDAYARQDVPIEAVIDAVAEQRDPSRMPLFQAQLSLQNVPVRAAAVDGLDVAPVRMDRSAAKNDLSFILDHRGDEGIGAEVEFNTDLFREETVEDLWRDYVQLLNRLAATPATGLLDLLQTPAVPDPAPAVAKTEFADLVTWFEAVAAAHAESPAVSDARQTLTYAQLNRRAGAIAAALLASGLPPEAPVGVLMGRSVEQIAAILGVLKAGGAYVPLAADHPPERLEFMLTHAATRAVIVDSDTAGLGTTLARARGIDVVRGDLVQDAPPVQRPRLGPASLAYIIYTSGSTGRPKGVMVEHRSVVNLVDALREIAYTDIGPRLRVALVAAPVFDASVQQIFAALLQGHTLCLVPDELRRDGAALSDWLAEQRIDLSDGTPTLLGLLLHGGFGERPLALRRLLIGGEALPMDIVRRWHATAYGRDIAIINVYGPTECCVDVVAHRLDAANAGRGYGAVAPIGNAMRNCRAAVVDAAGAAVPVGVPGELLIAGTCVGRGYVNDAQLTAERFGIFPATGTARAYRTGDLCRQRRDGVLEFLGRNDDQVKIHGHRIELGEVEHHLRAHPAITDVTVQARTTANGYRELVAYLVTRQAMDAGEVRSFAAARMPAYMIPAYFVPLASLPLTVSGKIDRQSLPDPRSATLLSSGAIYRAASDHAEQVLLDTWKSTLGLERPGVGDNYFTSGGDSIKALQLASRLRDAGWLVEIRDIFGFPTIEQLAPHLKRLDDAMAVAAEPQAWRSPLSAIQRFFFKTYGAAPVFNQAILLRPSRALDLARLERACAALSAHHPMLRARFMAGPQGWIQEVAGVDAVQPLVTHVDLTGAADALVEMDAHAAAEQHRFSLDVAPLWSAVLYELPGSQRLLLSAHHLIVDGVSWRILIDDLERLLETPAAPLTTGAASYAAWVAQQERAATEALRGELDLWAGEPRAAGDDCQRDRRAVHAGLAPDLSAALLTRAHHAYATEMNDLLLAAVARAWQAWTGERTCAITVEGHGREPLSGPIDLSRTVGWFTSMFPVRIELPADGDPGAAIKHVKQTLRAIPHKGAGYMVLREMGDAGHRVGALSPLAFNYLGQFDAAPGGWFAPAGERGPETATPDVALPWPLELTAVAVDGCVQITLAYSARRYDEANASRFLGHIVSEVETIVRHTTGRADTELSASDFDYAGLTEQGLDDFLRTL